MATRKSYTSDELEAIFDRTRGKCHICHKQLAFKNYAQQGARGAWQVDHSVPVAKGGTNHGNNLKAACIPCNLEKSTVTTRTARAWNGTRRAPLNAAEHARRRRNNTVAGGLAGAGIGAAVGGPVGALAGAAFGAYVGGEVDPDD